MCCSIRISVIKPKSKSRTATTTPRISNPPFQFTLVKTTRIKSKDYFENVFPDRACSSWSSLSISKFLTEFDITFPFFVADLKNKL
ncbi:hypothetical protein CPC08DRAFT_25594 [Agrocybe pediades]|nr:hypothetical protein CPC08DRAFT_25594 [Agrocybe pediades]